MAEHWDAGWLLLGLKRDGSAFGGWHQDCHLPQQLYLGPVLNIMAGRAANARAKVVGEKAGGCCWGPGLDLKGIEM